MGIDIYFPNISNINARKMIVLVELVVSGEWQKMLKKSGKSILINWSGIWTLLWFVGFCYMTDQWRQEPNQDLPGWNGRNSVQAALAFTFFSFLIWVIDGFLLRRFCYIFSSFLLGSIIFLCFSSFSWGCFESVWFEFRHSRQFSTGGSSSSYLRHFFCR